MRSKLFTLSYFPFDIISDFLCFDLFARIEEVTSDT